MYPNNINGFQSEVIIWDKFQKELKENVRKGHRKKCIAPMQPL